MRGISPHQAFAAVKQVRHRGQNVHVGGRGDQSCAPTPAPRPRQMVSDSQPKNQLRPLRTPGGISEVPAFCSIWVEQGAAISVESTTVPTRRRSPRAASMLIDAAEQDLALRCAAPADGES